MRPRPLASTRPRRALRLLWLTGLLGGALGLSCKSQPPSAQTTSCAECPPSRASVRGAAMMPKRSGFLVLEKLRVTRPVPIRVIMITANEGKLHKDYAEDLGVDDYIRKPFPMDRLVDSVARLLS